MTINRKVYDTTRINKILDSVTLMIQNWLKLYTQLIIKKLVRFSIEEFEDYLNKLSLYLFDKVRK